MSCNDKTIANTYYFSKFSDEELEILCRYSYPSILNYRNKINIKKQNIEGLFYEISQVYGNWNKKDRILPGLFDELFEQLKDTINIIEEYEKDDLLDKHSFLLSCYPLYSQDNLRRLSLLKYLTRFFEEEFINHGHKHLSGTYTHRWLNQKLKRMDIRINNLFKQYHEYTLEQCMDFAKEGLNNLIIKRIEGKSLPLVITNEKELINLFYYDIHEHNELTTRIEKCFKPEIGNSEYHLGLIPIWKDIPGKGISAYYFDYNKERLVLIVNHAKPPLIADDGIPYYQPGPTIKDLFNQAGKEDNFLEWFNSKDVKEKLGRHLLFGIIYRFTNKKEELSEEDFKLSSEYAKNQLKLLEDYFGVGYAFDDITSLIKEKEIEYIKNYNLKTEIKEHKIEIMNKLFPN